MAVNKETVTWVKHWSDKTFSFKTTRNYPNKFNNGEFAMIGMEHEGKKIMRAYSIASANHEDYLEFLSIKIDDGPLTSKLQHLKVGDEVLVNPRSTGTLVIDYLMPGQESKYSDMATMLRLTPLLNTFSEKTITDTAEGIEGMIPKGSHGLEHGVKGAVDMTKDTVKRTPSILKSWRGKGKRYLKKENWN